MARWTRRDVLNALGVTAATGVGATLGAGCVSETAATDETDGPGPDPTDDTDPPGPPWCGVEVGTPSEGWSPVLLDAHPALRDVGGHAVVRLGDDTVNIVHVEEGCYVAMGVVCTHEGCTVEVRSGPKFVCPCHGALFNWLGEPIAGPAPDPLPTWPAGLNGDAVWVRISEG